jgi:NAD(P)-dependent dehydrogenase (short-subunit alcohol dehydrogenase family)
MYKLWYLINIEIFFQYVAFLDVAEREGKTLETELLTKFGALRAKFIECDISDDTQLTAAFKQVFEKYRRLDVVINNAGVFSADDSDYKKLVDVNVVSI